MNARQKKQKHSKQCIANRCECRQEKKNTTENFLHNDHNKTHSSERAYCVAILSSCIAHTLNIQAA